MNIALTGISGFIGTAIARHATRAGHRVRGLVRATSRVDHLEPWADRLVVGAQDDAQARSELLDGADVVIHNSFDWRALKHGAPEDHLQGNLVSSLDLLREAGDRPFIYLSSVAVHHFIDDRWNGSIDALHPTRPGMLYGALKASVEAHMWAAHAERGQPVTFIRPCAVYGIDPRRSRSIGWPIVERVRRGEAFARQGGGKFVHVEDVAAATVAAIGNPAANPGTYHLVDCYARWADWAKMAAELLGKDIEIDCSSPEAPKNMFDTSDVETDLGVRADRGLDGIRAHLEELISLQDDS